MTRINIATLDECLENLTKFMPKSTFDPYSSHIIANGKTKIEEYEGQTTTQYNKMLDDLEKERVRIMSQPIYDRKIRVYQVEPQYQK